MTILPYSENNLAATLSNQYTPVDIITSKNHFIFLKDYFGASGLNAKSILVEDEYVSKDFIHDFATYYAFCFEKYPKFCKRVHFFTNEFSKDQFQKIILSEEEANEEFWKNYLGFIVVKPIPVTVIGYTILKTYSGSSEYNDRNFWGVRNYTIHLYGNEIKFPSLAFQEQDSVLAACATTAIWSMLNKAAADFHTILKSPSEITKDADVVSPDGSRLFPNKGLDLLQICQAIFNSGLVSEVKQPDFSLFDKDGNFIAKYISSRYLKKILNAYSSLGIPIILVIKVPNGNTFGLHAITVSGFKMSEPKTILPHIETSWLADNIDKFYAHDDQWGPFARITFKNDFELETPWTRFHPLKISTLVTNIIVPIYPKVRISYEEIEVIVLGLDTILSLFFDKKIIADLVWDIKIELSENVKSQIKNSSLDHNEKILRLITSMPKYLWIATCYVGVNKIFDFTFDATDVNNGMISEDVLCYLPSDIKSILLEFLTGNKDILQKFFNHRAGINYYQFFIEKLN